MTRAAGHPHANDLLAFQGGEANATLQHRIEEHLGACGECSAYVALLEDTVSTLEDWAEEDPPAGGLERVMAEVRSVSPALPRRSDWLWPVLASLLGVAAGSLVIYATGTRLVQWLSVLDAPLLVSVHALSGFSLAALVFFGIGSVLTLALAPMLLLEMQSRERPLAAR
jgi:anti-sigma factor RsiW